MNILLFAPALFLLLVENYSTLSGVIKNLFVCAAIQVSELLQLNNNAHMIAHTHDQHHNLHIIYARLLITFI